MAEARMYDVVVLDVDAIEPDPDNPQVEDLGTFNDLISSIVEHGFLEPILVRPISDDRFRIVSGEHRWKAARMAGMERVPAVVKDDWADDGDPQIKLVQMNLLRGKLDPARFTKLWKKLQSQYDPETLRVKMGFARKDGELRRLIKDVTKALPEKARDEMRKRAERIESVEDLATVVQSLFTKYGSTLDRSFVLFAFGGRTHLMVRSMPESFVPIEELARRCEETGEPLDEALARRARCPCLDCHASPTKTEVRPDDQETDDRAPGAQDPRDGGHGPS